MAIPAGIDGNAPVIARHEIDINAPLDTVWRLQTDVNDWPAWHDAVVAAAGSGAEGAAVPAEHLRGGPAVLRVAVGLRRNSSQPGRLTDSFSAPAWRLRPGGR